MFNKNRKRNIYFYLFSMILLSSFFFPIVNHKQINADTEIYFLNGLTYSNNRSENTKRNFFTEKSTGDTIGALAADVSQSQLLMQKSSTIGNQKLFVVSEDSSSLDPFYYLDPELEEYLQLSLCHDFIGDEESAGFFGTNGYTGKGITVAIMNGAVAYNDSYFSKGYNSLTKSVVVTDIFGSYRTPNCPDDYNDHATCCASLVKQVAPESNIISIGAAEPKPESGDPDYEAKNDLYHNQLKGSFEWLLEHYKDNGIKIKIVSRSSSFLVTSTTPPEGWNRVEQIIKFLSGNDHHPDFPDKWIGDEDKILFVFPVGNWKSGYIGYDVHWPAGMGDKSNIIGVGSIDYNDIKRLVEGGINEDQAI